MVFQPEAYKNVVKTTKLFLSLFFFFEKILPVTEIPFFFDWDFLFFFFFSLKKFITLVVNFVFFVVVPTRITTAQVTRISVLIAMVACRYPSCLIPSGFLFVSRRDFDVVLFCFVFFISYFVLFCQLHPDAS